MHTFSDKKPRRTDLFHKNCVSFSVHEIYGISQLQIVLSDLHLVTYLNRGQRFTHI